MHRHLAISPTASKLLPRTPSAFFALAGRRTYALSRYRSADGKNVSRIASRRNAVAASRAAPHQPKASSSSSEQLSAQPSSAPSTNPSAQSRPSFLSSIDTYVPTGPIEDATNVSPPPVDPGDLLHLSDGAAAILSQPSLVVCRQLEMMNVFLGFEQANRYRLVNARGEDVGFLAEQEGGFGSSIRRQMMRGHRPFSCVVMDVAGNIVLRVERPFSWINSRISVYKGREDPHSDNKIGECQQIWHPYRRKYSLYQRYHDEDATTHPAEDSSTKAVTVREETGKEEAYTQFAAFDSRLLAWDFYLQSERGQVLGSINRNFMGFGRELFSDTGQYVLRFDRSVADQEVQTRVEKGVGINDELKKVADESAEAKAQAEKALVPVEDGKSLTLDQRAVLLAAAVTIDIDYFSRQGGGGLHMPMLWMPMPGAGVPPPAEVPGAEGAPEVGQVSSAPETPIASPEYGESPGIDYGGYESSFPSEDPGFGQGDVMQDPWASAPQGDEGGGWMSSLGDFFGGGDE